MGDLNIFVICTAGSGKEWKGNNNIGERGRARSWSQRNQKRKWSGIEIGLRMGKIHLPVRREGGWVRVQAHGDEL